MRRFAFCLLLAGCARSTTTSVVVRVQNGEATPPAAVTISVFDGHGLLGRSRIAPAVLPGQLTIAGLTGAEGALRVVAAAEQPRLLDGTTVQPRAAERLTVSLTLRAGTADSDGDGVPNDLDDCPAAADPDQANSAGSGLGDACRGDLGVPVDGAAADLAPLPPQDLAGVPLLVEGFESGSIGAAWRQIATNGTLTVDSTLAHRGSYALHVHQDPLTSAGAQVQIAETGAVPSPDLYVRAFVWLPTGSDAARVALFAVDQTVLPYAGVNLNVAGAPPTFNSYNNVSGTPVSMSSTTPALPTSQWVCIEWHLQIGVNGFAKVMLNGTEVTALSGTQSTLANPPLGLIAIGVLAPAQPTNARDLWYDDIIVDAVPIGCAK